MVYKDFFRRKIGAFKPYSYQDRVAKTLLDEGKNVILAVLIRV